MTSHQGGTCQPRTIQEFQFCMRSTVGLSNVQWSILKQY